MKKLLYLVVLCFSGFGFADNECPLFLEAVNYYKAESYPAAISVWETCVQQGFQNADVYYNLGNAEFRANDLGHAIWAYESALRLDPTNPDIIANLEFARSHTVDKVEANAEDDNPVLKTLWKIHHALSLNQQLVVLLFLAWSAGLLWVLAAWRNNERFRTISYSCLFGIAFFAAIIGLDSLFKAWSLETDNIGIVLSRSADVMSGPGDQYQVLHELHEGTRVEVRDQGEGWINVRIGENVNGFVKADLLGIVK